MIRFPKTFGFVLLGSLMLSPMAMGQEVPKGDEAPQEQAEKAATLLQKAKAVENMKAAEALARQALEKAEKAQAGNVATFLNEADVLSYSNFANLRPLPDALEVNFGLSLADADNALRAQLEIPPGEGIVVVEVKPGSLAEAAGMKVNDILLSLGDDKVGEVSKAKQIFLGLGKDPLEVKLIREGKARRMSIVGPKHGFPPEAAEYWIGVPVSPVDATLRAHLPSLAAETGLIVNDVVKESPAEKAGVKKSDILVSFDGKPVKNSDALIAAIQATQGKAVAVELLRVGKLISVTITPAKRTHPTVININSINSSADGRFFRFATPNTAFVLPLNPNVSYVEVKTPHAVAPAIVPPPGSPTPEGQGKTANPKPEQIQLKLLMDQLVSQSDPSTARVEAQLKEISAKLEEIRKTLDGLKKTETK